MVEGRTAEEASRRLSLPAWVRALDEITIGLVILAVFTAIFGGFRLAGGRLSVTSASRLLIWAAVAFGVRHLAWRRPPLSHRLFAGLARAQSAEALKAAWAPFVGSRLPVLLVGYLAIFTIGYGQHPPWRLYKSELLNLPARWDSAWYLGIATSGYRSQRRSLEQENIVFFPALPLLMRVAGRLIGNQPLLAGLAVALAAFFWALVYLYRLARDELGAEAATGTLALIAAYPFALFFSTAYAEALFLLGAVGAFYHLRRREAIKAGAWGLLVGLTRPNGCLLSVPLAWLALFGRRAQDSEQNGGTSRLRLLTAAAMPGAGMLLFSAYIYRLTGHPFTWVEGHAAWGRTYQGIGWLIERYGSLIKLWGHYDAVMTIDAMNGAALVLALVALWPVIRRLGVAYGLFIALNVIPPFLAGGLLSMGRLTSVLFPVFMWLGARIPAARRPAWVTGFAVGQGLLAALFFTWRELF